MVGKQYKHKKGTIYTVIMLTNTGSDDSIGHPINVVYMGQDGKIWSRLLSEWDERCKLIEPTTFIQEFYGRWEDSVDPGIVDYE